MYLIVDELKTSLTQTVTLTREMWLKAIRIDLYKHNISSGSIKVSIKDGATEIGSKTLTMAFIEANVPVSNTYLHGMITFELSNPVRLPKQDYQIVMEGAGGYSFTSNSFVGWKKEYENRTNTPTDITVEDLDSPHSFQLWSYQ